MARKDRILLQQIKNSSAPRKQEGFAGKPVHIWSGEHGAWWRPEARGYTCDRTQAGVYAFEEAFRSTFHCGPEKRIAFVLAA